MTPASMRNHLLSPRKCNHMEHSTGSKRCRICLRRRAKIIVQGTMQTLARCPDRRDGEHAKCRCNGHSPVTDEAVEFQSCLVLYVVVLRIECRWTPYRVLVCPASEYIISAHPPLHSKCPLCRVRYLSCRRRDPTLPSPFALIAHMLAYVPRILRLPNWLFSPGARLALARGRCKVVHTKTGTERNQTACHGPATCGEETRLKLREESRT